MSFFARVLPATGPFTLFVGITGPDGKLAEQRHYNGLSSVEAVEKVIQQLSTQPLNIFFATGSYAGKNRKDPVAKRAFFLDLDGKDFGSIEDALRGLSVFVKATGLPPPSIYVHSGRGVHVYWCLDRDIPTSEWVPVAKALKAKCEELDFKADSSATADPARVLRAPGTLNRKGTNPLPCRVLADNGTVHTLESIARQLSPAIVGAPVVSGAIQRLSSLAPADVLSTKTAYRDLKADEVEAMLSCIELPTIDGRDMWITILNAVQDWGKKSEESWDLFDAWSATQPGYNQAANRKTWESFSPGGGITVGTLVKMAMDNGYEPPGTPAPVAPVSLAEQIAGTAPTAEDSELPVAHGVIGDSLLMAAHHAVTSSGASRFTAEAAKQFLANEFVMIMEQEGIFYSITKRCPLTARVIDDMLTRYMPLNSNGVPTNASVVMRRYGTRHTVEALGFHPSAPAVYSENGKSYVNQYTAPADFVVGTPQEIQLIEHFWNYMFPRATDQQFSTYLKQCYAHLVKHPEIKIESAPLIVSPEFGTGKTTLAYEIPLRLVGGHNSQMVSNKTLRGSFSGYVNGKKFLHFDEIHINGRWDSDDTANGLKSLIAGSVVEVRPLYMNSFNIPNRIWVSATSNYDDAMSLPTEGERRWGVYAHQPVARWTVAQKEAYFKVIYRWLNTPRAAGVLRWYFNQVDLSGFNPAAPPPLTQAKKLMVSKSQVREVRALAEAAADGVSPFDKDLTTNDKIRQFLHSETGKTYSGYETREYFFRALPQSVALKQTRMGNATIRPLCWKNQHHWQDQHRTNEEIKKELGP